MNLRIVSFSLAGQLLPGLLTDDDTVAPLTPLLSRLGFEVDSVRGILAVWPHLAPLLREAIEADDTVSIPADEVTFGPPIPQPGQVVAVGFNYDTHVGSEMGLSEAAEPVIFIKSPSSVTGPYDPIIRPAAAHALDYEAEVAIVIGRPGYQIPAERAFEHVAGYMLANDVTARDIALPNGFQSSPLQAQIVRGKGYPSFCPTGPWLVMSDSADETFEFELAVNSELRQAGSTKDMTLGFDRIIETVSATLGLRTGDIILTGTPAGCGFQLDPPQYLQPGDVVEARSPQLGEMRALVRDETR